MKTVFIYSLSTLEEPENIRYIGKADNIKKRLNRHLQSYYLNEGTYKSNWLKSEIIKGHTPIINLIDEVKESEWEFWEIYWISQFKSWGFKLTNKTDGGEGVKLSIDEVKKRSKVIFDKTTIRLSEDIIKFNVHKKENLWIAERNCPQCNSTIHYKANTRPYVFKEIRRAENGNRCCVSCDYKNREGSGNSFFGKSHTPELQEFLRNIAPKKKVIMLSLDDEKLNEFNSIREAANKTKINRKGISGCCNNLKNYNTAGGYKWKFS
jgi:hypothetical protein